MKETNPKALLRTIVKEHGFEEVERCLQEIAVSKSATRGAQSGIEKPIGRAKNLRRKKRTKTTASQYVVRLDVPPEKVQSVSELAARFDAKAFLPAFNDAVEFCLIYGIEPPASRSRANVIPRVFKFVVSLESDKIQRMLDEGHFSGPSRLGPISDAIARNGRITRPVPHV